MAGTECTVTAPERPSLSPLQSLRVDTYMGLQEQNHTVQTEKSP